MTGSSKHRIHNFKPEYPLIKAYKDMISAAEIRSKKDIPLPVFSAVMQTYQMALAQGLGNENKGAMIKVCEKVFGVEVREKENHLRQKTSPQRHRI